MNENPYQSPSAESQVVDDKSGQLEYLKCVAQYQKGITFCFLFCLVALICQYTLPAEYRRFVGLGVFIAGFVSAAFVFLLAITIYNTTAGVLLGILTLIPCVGIIVLLVLNNKATGILRQNGIDVDLFGADLSEIEIRYNKGTPE